MEQRQDRLAVLEGTLAELHQRLQTVHRRLALWRGLAGLVLALALVVAPLRVVGQGSVDITTLADRVAALEAALASETEARNAFQAALQAALADERAARQAADTAVQGKLDAVVTNTLSSAKGYADTRVAAEASARQTADAGLQNSLINLSNAASPVLGLLGVNPSGGLVVAGDLAVRHMGVSGNLAVGGGIVATGAIDARGDIGVTRNLYVGGDTVAFGAIDARGDIGVTQNLYVGKNTVAFGTLEARKGIVSLGDVNVCGTVSDTFGGGILHANSVAKATKDCPE
jgi:hypothetical protein